MLKAVLFDLWGTLIAEDPAAGEARRLLRIQLAREALADAGFDYAAADIEAAFLAAGVEHELLHASERDFTAHGRTVAYLRQLEGLPTRLYWRKADLVAGDYPKAVLRLTVYTLSFDPSWMSV